MNPRSRPCQPTTKLVDLAMRLQAARNFVEIGLTVCTMSREHFGLEHCVISLLARDGRAVITIDNNVMSDATARRAPFEQRWRLDPLLQSLRHHRVAHDDVAKSGNFGAGPNRVLALPILALSRLIGVIQCGIPSSSTTELRVFLSVLSLHVSVRLAQLGITHASTTDGLDGLTTRQFDVSRLTVQGYTNVEIADLLGVSINTIKKHLGVVFDRLQITNRTELAGRLLGGVHRDGLPDGVTRVGDCTVFKSLERHA